MTSIASLAQMPASTLVPTLVPTPTTARLLASGRSLCTVFWPAAQYRSGLACGTRTVAATAGRDRLRSTARLFLAGLALSALAAHAQVLEVKDAWARTTVQGQKATGAFMTLTAKEGATLVGAASPVAGVVEVHEMKMEDGVMKMRALPSLNLPAGQPVALKPGGYHVMLMDLKAALPKDTVVPLTLVFKDAKGVERRQEIKLPVSSAAPGAAGPAAPPHRH